VGSGIVRVEASREGARLRIAVRDNGLGFKETAREGIGLRNVRERLKAAYGERASLEISSTRGEGTSIIIDMPVDRGAPGS
jgi:sensor histidine kinase YesM